MAETHSYKMFGLFTRKFEVKEAHPSLDVMAAFADCTNRQSHMNAAQLRRFLVEYQAEEGCSDSDASQILNEIRRRRNLEDDQYLCVEDFFYFLLFADDLNGPIKKEVHHDMTAPLQHYFIYTGHNSYLTGNQLSSDCSDEPIIKALQRGVKVIELDLWPNSDEDDIDVLHGRTLTTPVPLIKCLKSINEHAFAKSPYAVIITLEDHLTPDLQTKVAKMVIEVFGEKLYQPDNEHIDEFPSPEELKGKIILSTKPPEEYLKAKQSKDNKGKDSKLGKDSSEDEMPEDSDGDQDDEDSDNDVSSAQPTQAGVPEYKRLIAIRAGKPKNGLSAALKGGLEKIRRLSLSETALEKAAEDHGADLVRFTQRNFLRIYPKGTRITSSNYKPLIGWIHGAQMVAFNMQGYGKSLWIMHGMFRANGGCGYLKKPNFLIRRGPNDEVFHPSASSEVKKNLKVRVYMGDGWRMDFSKTHFDSYSPPDFYVKLCVMGAPADYAKKKTKIIDDDWVPHWDEEFTFPLAVPELALLRILVKEYNRSEKDDFAGQTCLPVSEIRPGFRSVPLYDKKGEKLPSVRLLIKFQFV